jgi:hypothetical protein
MLLPGNLVSAAGVELVRHAENPEDDFSSNIGHLHDPCNKAVNVRDLADHA